MVQITFKSRNNERIHQEHEAVNESFVGVERLH